jgi:hypothetical protein
MLRSILFTNHDRLAEYSRAQYSSRDQNDRYRCKERQIDQGLKANQSLDVDR